MNDRAAIAAAALLTALAGLAAAPATLGSAAQATTPAGPSEVTSDLLASGGRKIGSVRLTEGPRGVLIRVQANGLPAGWHGAHLHLKADCSDPKFERAGGHTHAGAKSVHGLLNPQATDTGDLPNVNVAADGSLNAELFSSFVSLNGPYGGRQHLVDADGAAFLIHANADDQRSQPIGGAGARIACAAFRPAR